MSKTNRPYAGVRKFLMYTFEFLVSLVCLLPLLPILIVTVIYVVVIKKRGTLASVGRDAFNWRKH